MRRAIGPIGASLVALLVMAGCGSGDQTVATDELVAMRIQGTLDFRLDASDGPEHVVHLNEGTVIDRDGAGTRTSVGFKGSRTFQVPDSELQSLKTALAQLDLDDLEARFGAEGNDTSTTTLTYGGHTVVLGDRIDAVNQGEGDEQADRFHRLASTIDHLSAQALPPRIKNVDRVANRELKEITRKLKPGLGPTCGQAQAMVAKHPGWESKTQGAIYSHVRPAEQPCP